MSREWLLIEIDCSAYFALTPLIVLLRPLQSVYQFVGVASTERRGWKPVHPFAMAAYHQIPPTGNYRPQPFRHHSAELLTGCFVVVRDHTVNHRPLGDVCIQIETIETYLSDPSGIFGEMDDQNH